MLIYLSHSYIRTEEVHVCRAANNDYFHFGLKVQYVRIGTVVYATSTGMLDQDGSALAVSMLTSVDISQCLARYF